MKNILIFFLMMTLMSNHSNAQHAFHRIYGDSVSTQNASMVKEVPGGYIIYGTKQDINGNGTLNICKLNTHADTIFTKQIFPPNASITSIVNYNSMDDSYTFGALSDSGKSVFLILIKVNNSGSIVTQNKFLLQIDTFNKIIRINIVVSPDKGNIISGLYNLNNKASAFLVKLDSVGRTKWVVSSYHPVEFSYMNGFYVGNNFIIAGLGIKNYESGIDFSLIDSTGHLIKSKFYILNTSPTTEILGSATQNHLTIQFDQSRYYSQKNGLVTKPTYMRINQNLDTIWMRSIVPSDTFNYPDCIPYAVCLTHAPNSSILVNWAASVYAFNNGLTLIDSNGNFIWTKSIDKIDSLPKNSLKIFSSIIPTDDGGCALVGYLRIPYIIKTSYFYYFLKIDSLFSYTGIESIKFIDKNINIYPNPANSSFVINSQQSMNNALINLYNLQGQLVQSYPNLSGTSLIIPRNNLPAGVYLLKIQDSQNQPYFTKVIYN